MEKFKELGIEDAILAALESKGFEEPSPIQAQAIPFLLQNPETDLIGKAQTGTGKTAAFGIPVLQGLSNLNGKVKALILCPTRELAIQVQDELVSLKGQKKVFLTSIYGGQSIGMQLGRLERGVDVVVGTPGRVIDHLERGSLDLSELQYFVLDEADEMLNMGFIEDIEKIFKSTPATKQTLLFSATMPPRIKALSSNYMRDYEVIEVAARQLTADLTEQIYFEVSDNDRFDALTRIMDIEEDFYAMIFCKTKLDTDELANKLSDRSYPAEALHGDIQQSSREKILKRFRSKKTRILVCTDVAARGIDVDNLSHVINFGLPQDPESYVHRIGRTGRAGNSGTAITFISPADYRKLMFIQKLSKSKIEKGTLPDPKMVVDSKIQKLRLSIRDILDENRYKSYIETAELLLEEAAPEEVVASLLKHSFRGELDEKSYRDIKELKAVDRKGTARLFLAKGRNHFDGPRELAEFIAETAQVDPNQIKGIRILDEFSFFNAPFAEAEAIIEIFKREKNGRKPLVTKAKERDDRGGDRRGDRRGGDRRGGERRGGGDRNSRNRRR